MNKITLNFYGRAKCTRKAMPSDLDAFKRIADGTESKLAFNGLAEIISKDGIAIVRFLPPKQPHTWHLSKADIARVIENLVNSHTSIEFTTEGIEIV